MDLYNKVMFIRLGVVLWVICTHKVDSYCYHGWAFERDSCYRVFNTTVAWQQAVRECGRHGAALVTLNDITEQTFILHLRPTSQDVHHWIGFYRNGTGWRWFQQLNTSINHLNTTALEPDETCAALSMLGTWIPRKCDDKLPYICESGQLSSNVTPVTTTYNVKTSVYRGASSNQYSTPTEETTAAISNMFTDAMVLLGQCLTDTDTAVVDDCLRDVFKSSDTICAMDSQSTDHDPVSYVLSIEFYKIFVQKFENFIEKDLSLSVCEKNKNEAFVMIETILGHFKPGANLTVDGGIQFHSDHLELSWHRLQGRQKMTTIIFESYITGCLVNKVILDDNTKDDIDLLVAVVDTRNVIRVNAEEGDLHPAVQHYLVSPVLIISAYRNGRKASVGLTFTIAYHSVDDIVQTKHLNITHHEVACVYYQPRNKSWSRYGCKVLDVNAYTVKCSCNHTTSFGVIMKIKVYEISRENEVALSIITYVGCSLSMVTMFLALTVFTCIRSLQSERVFVHRNLCLAILCAQIVFLAAGKAIQNKVVCRVTAVVLHYCFLSIFTWMLVEGLHLYTKVIQVFGTDGSKNNYYLCFGWGLPLVLVVISSAADWEGYGTKTSCWLSIDRKTIWAFVGPAVAVIIVNLLILIMVLRVVVSSAKNDRPSKALQTRAAIKAALFLLHLLGLTWIFGLLAVNRQTTVFEYLFALSNSLQGFFVFLFHCVLNTEVRQALRRVRDRRAVINEDIQTDSVTSESDTSSVAVEGTLRFRLSFIGGGRRCQETPRNAWTKQDNLNLEFTRKSPKIVPRRNMSNTVVTGPVANKPDEHLPLIYI